MARNWQLPVWLPFFKGSQGLSPDKMHLAAKGVSCKKTEEPDFTAQQMKKSAERRSIYG